MFVLALEWWEKYELKGVDFTFVPAKHWSGRGAIDRFKVQKRCIFLFYLGQVTQYDAKNMLLTRINTVIEITSDMKILVYIIMS